MHPPVDKYKQVSEPGQQNRSCGEPFQHPQHVGVSNSKVGTGRRASRLRQAAVQKQEVICDGSAGVSRESAGGADRWGGAARRLAPIGFSPGKSSQHPQARLPSKPPHSSSLRGRFGESRLSPAITPSTQNTPLNAKYMRPACILISLL